MGARMSSSVLKPSCTTMNNPQPCWSSHPIYAPGFLFSPLFAKVIILWCGHVPAAAALVFCSVALFAKMCSAIQFHLHVFTREPGEHKESGAVELILFPPLLSFFVCTYLWYLSTFSCPLLNMVVTLDLTHCSYLKLFCKPRPDMFPAFGDKRRLSQICPEMCFDAMISKLLFNFLIAQTDENPQLCIQRCKIVTAVQKAIKNQILAPEGLSWWMHCRAIHHGSAAQHTRHAAVELLSPTAGVCFLVKWPSEG